MKRPGQIPACGSGSVAEFARARFLRFGQCAPCHFRKALVGLGAAVALTFHATAFPSMQIVSSGPISTITVGVDGSLQVLHVDYPFHGQFFPSTGEPGDSGFFLRHNGTVDGMDYLSHTGTAAGSLYSKPFHPVSQSLRPDGLQVTTVMDTSTDQTTEFFTVTQTTTYQPGDAWFLVENVVRNLTSSAQTLDLFAAADIYLANEDRGFGYVSAACAQAVGGSNSNRDFNIILQAAPGSPPPTAYQEAGYDDIWRIIGGPYHFDNTVSAEYIDNGAGLEWREVTIPPGGSYTVSYYWVFGNLTCVTNASIAGTVFNDLDFNGAQDASEPPLANWTVRLSSGQTTLTDTNGQYFFWVWPGNYTVTEDKQAGWIQTLPGGAGCYNVALAMAQGTNVNFANYQPSALPPPIDPPVLNGPNLVLHWAHPGWRLQKNTNLVTGTWQVVPIPLATNSATIAIQPNQNQFFRLTNP